jgi:phospholipid/cholesterol/gamma-HCH transport system permease protein
VSAKSAAVSAQADHQPKREGLHGLQRTVRYALRPLLAVFHFIGEFTAVLVRGLIFSRWRRTMRREFGRYLYQVGVLGVPAVVVTAVLTGIGLVTQIVYWLSFAGEEQRIGEFLILVLVRLVTPIVTALVILGRSGSVLVDEIGRLSVSGHLKLLQSYGIDPIEFVTIPRCFAMAIAVFLLSVLFMHVALWTGLAAVAFSGFGQFSAGDLLAEVLGGMTINDHLLLIVKPLLTGYVICYISIWLGMRVQEATHGIRKALPKAFVFSLLATFAIGTLISASL